MWNDYVKYPLYLLTHPIAGFDDFKRNKKGKMSVALTFLALACIVNIIQYRSTGFIINYNDPQRFNSIKLCLFIILPVVLVTIGNWLITTLFDGKGTLKEIFMMICYSLFPYIVISFPNILLSNILTLDEMAFYFLIQGIGTFLLGYMIFFGMISVHEYGVLKTVITTIFTVAAVGFLLFFFLLFFTLIQQFYNFVYSIYREISVRYF